ncbi:MAG: hypothetical protein E6Q58_02855 [Niabella sp.]|nr:MAG: hypothetical protein E6Q58_02855 [Niabella sp.]
MKKIIIAVLMLIGLNFTTMAQTTPVKKATTKTEVKQTAASKETPQKKHHKKHRKHHKKHNAASKKADVKKEETKTK